LEMNSTAASRFVVEPAVRLHHRFHKANHHGTVFPCPRASDGEGGRLKIGNGIEQPPECIQT
jgi:hypothetical protein